MKTIIISATLLILTLLSQSLYAIADREIYLIRHAEKQADGSKNPSLSTVGKQRAGNISEMLKSRNITAIYSSDFDRTKQTAEPLAKLLNLKVSLYDPHKLKDFAEQILTGKANVLIVGHSNTTPGLAFLLGGDAFGDIDESEYDRVYRLKFGAGQVDSKLLHSEPIQVKNKPQAVSINSDHFFSGELTFEMSLSGKVVGHSIHQFERQNDEFVINEKTVIKQYGIDADINVRMNSRTLAPHTMTMSGSMGEPVKIDLNWQGDQLKGHSLQRRAVYKEQGDIQIDRTLSPHQVERSSVLMLAHLVHLPNNQPITFQWYNAYDNDSRIIEASYLGEQTVTVPAGTFETYKLQFLGGAPSQIYYISKEKKPKVVKIEIIAAPWSYELKDFKLK